MELAVVLVHYHTPRLLARAVASFRVELRELGLERQSRLIVVDNGSREQDRSDLQRLEVEWIEPGENLGYAGGINVGVAATGAERLVVANPDLQLRGALAPLLDELDRGAGIVGPAFYQDDALEWRMPPAQRRDRVSALLDALAEGRPRWHRRARRRWRHHAHRHWQARQALTSFELSGALLAFTRAAWSRVGELDAGYRLYFEETDWLERARHLGVEARYVPSARVVHAHGRSTRREPRAAEWFEASARRFRRRHYGAPFARLLEALSSGAALPEPTDRMLPGLRPGERVDLASLYAGPDAWLEVSPRPLGYPAIGRPLASPPPPWTVPSRLVEELGSPLRLAVVDERGIERAVRWLVEPQNRSLSASE